MTLKTNNIGIKLFLLFLIAFTSHKLVCQEAYFGTGDFKFKNYTIFDGLPSTSITCIEQDDKGFMWFGTRDGVSRFDGFNFLSFSHNSEDEMSLSHNQIQSIYLDSQGELWVGTKKGLNRYIEGVGFEKYYRDENDPFSLAGNIVLSICEDLENNLWIGTDNGLHKYDRVDKKFERYFHNVNDTNSLRSNFIKKIYPDSKGALWMITGRGVEKYHNKKRMFEHYILEDIDKNTDLKDVNLAGIIKEDSKGRIWAGDTNGLWLYNSNEKNFESFLGENNILEDIPVRALWEDGYGNMLIGAYTGLYINNFEKGKTKIIQHDKYDPYSISKNSIHSIFEDKEGNLWIGTWAGGINYLDKNFNSFSHFSEISGLSYPVVSSFIEDESKNLWIGTEGGGLNYFDKSTGTFASFKYDENNKFSLSEDNIHDIVQDKNGNLWIATFGGGLNFFNPNQKPAKFIHFKNDTTDSSSISSNYLFALFIDSKQRVWIGANDGVSMYNPETKEFIRFSQENQVYGQVTVIYENYLKDILVGTSTGLGIADLEKNIVIYEPLRKINKIVDEYVLCIFQDNKSDYWIGTDGNGLVHVKNDFSSIVTYTKNQGLPNDVVYGILPDNFGNLWLSTHSGLSKFNIDLKTFDNYDVHDGLQSNEFNFDAYSMNSTGEFVFGGVNGFNMFYPSAIKKNDTSLPVVLTEFKINEKAEQIGDENSSLTKPISETDEVVLNHNQSLFSFEFIGLNYSRPDKNEYAYMLEGLNKEWLYIGNRREVTFTNIQPGDYIFKVKASNNVKNAWNGAVTSVKIKILPPPWRTWWAYLGYLFLGVLIGYLLWKYAQLRINDRNALRNEKLEREKDEEIYELKLRFFTNISHELRTPLTLIIGPLERLVSRSEDFKNSIKDEISSIHSNAQTLLRHVNNIMDFRKDEMGQLKLKAAKGNIVKFCNETFISFRQMAESRNIKYTFKDNLEQNQVFFDRDKMEIVLYNLLSNAFKFTPDDGFISFSISPVYEADNKFKTISISIKDSGYGIEEKHKALIFDRFFQIESIEGASNGTGIGLALTKRLIELHHGTIRVESEINAGSEFILEIPIGKKHLKNDEIFKEFRNGEDVASYSQSSFINKKHTESVHIKKGKDKELNENLPILLIIEDNYDVRKFVVSCFEDEYDIKEASNGGIGYEMATELIPDLIISDVMMPEMDGISLCSKLKKDISTCHIPIILLTARTSLIFKKDGLETGADDYINKPFTPSILQLKVRNIMESRKKLHEYFIRNYRVNPKEVIINSKDDEFLEKAINCVEKNLSDSNFNVTTFINEIGMSRSVLFRKIKSLTGLSTTGFIRTIRIKRAAQILVQRQLSISETAYEVGFGDLKYFRTCFRKQFNCSPSQYIEQHMKSKDD